MSLFEKLQVEISQFFWFHRISSKVQDCFSIHRRRGFIPRIGQRISHSDRLSDITNVSKFGFSSAKIFEDASSQIPASAASSSSKEARYLHIHGILWIITTKFSSWGMLKPPLLNLTVLPLSIFQNRPDRWRKIGSKKVWKRLNKI